MKVLVLNSGSSSQKSCLYEIGDALPPDPPDCLWEGKIEWVDEKALYSIKNLRGASRKEAIPAGSRAAAIQRLLKSLWSGPTQAVTRPSEIDVAGHRVVHGGPLHFEPAFVTPEVKAAIEGVSAFAPLHNHAELEGMQMVTKILGPVPQVAVFDTGFHRSMPLAAKTYPGPYEWFERGILRYGFHGTNHEYCAQRAAQLLGQDLGALKLVTCHLGNGCSLTAIREGRSVDTTMGFTPLEGLMMGTRSGSIDPSIVTYLMRRDQLSGTQVDEILNHQSGLLGISGTSSDMRQILAAAKDPSEPAKRERAQLALDMYVHRLRLGIGAMIAALGGIDALVFTAGVGENSPELRAAVCDGFAFLGLRLDREKNAQPLANLDRDLSAPDAAVRVFAIRAQEDWMIARQCWNLVRSKQSAARA